MWDWACRSSAQINYVRKLSLIALVKAGIPAVAPKERRLVELAVQLRRKGFLLPLTSNATHFQKILMRLVISRGGDSSGSYRPAAKMAKIAKFFRNGGDGWVRLELFLFKTGQLSR